MINIGKVIFVKFEKYIKHLSEICVISAWIKTSVLSVSAVLEGCKQLQKQKKNIIWFETTYFITWTKKEKKIYYKFTIVNCKN